MAVITNPTPGGHFSNGLTAGDTQTLAVGTTTANGTSIGYNARWQWNLTGAESTANAGSNLQLQAIADDGFTVVATAISVNRATGVVSITGGGELAYFSDGSVSAPSIAFTSSHSTGIYYTTNAVNVTANGVRSMQFATATTGVNYLVSTPAATGGNVSLTAAGSDTDVGLILGSKGAGVVSLGGTTVANGSIHAVTTASSVNFLEVAGGTTGNAATITSTGTDTDVGLTITAKGAGQIRMGDTTSNVVLGPGTAIATNATVGHAMIPTCAGTPTGVPVGAAIGNAAIILDTTGNKLWLYDNGTWKGVVVA